MVVEMNKAKAHLLPGLDEAIQNAQKFSDLCKDGKVKALLKSLKAMSEGESFFIILAALTAFKLEIMNTVNEGDKKGILEDLKDLYGMEVVAVSWILED